ncbi:PQQ-binding-like beta-propeller repeat protein [Rhodococcus pyridinivorans]|uniref:PQQ-binding-like beta-propeller repeat protein n=1 Tax=Rhodococcus pyridinivorans TaxID=103816 RepID=UPI00280B51D1|nr:PQQ-binding-like beta-propeller repeat protein [Rhodococcus pyridinivorans]WMM74460.1 PQQ-binding-like beta-propeller repeat protein [Rhodococcus pyridinivorans]
MALTKKVAIAAGTAGVVAVVGATAAGLAFGGSGNDAKWPNPNPGTYAAEPTEAWSTPMPDPKAEVLFSTASHLVLSAPSEEGTSVQATKLLGINIDTGKMDWERTFARSDCGKSISRYEPSSALVVCQDYASNVLSVVDPSNGSNIASHDFESALKSDLIVGGETIYSCRVTDHAVTFQAGSGISLDSKFSIEIPVSDSSCDLDYDGTHVAAYGGMDNWVTVADLEGNITFQSFSTSAQFLDDGTLMTFYYDKDEKELTDEYTIIDANGTHLRDRDESIGKFTVLGREHSKVSIDKEDNIRDSNGEILWKYSSPEEYSLIGSFGEVVVMHEDETRLRGYDLVTGTPKWATSFTEFYPGGEIPESVDLRDDFSAIPGRWRLRTDGDFLIIATGTLLSGVDGRTGEIAWQKPFRGWFFQQHRDYVLMVGDNQIHALQFN